MNPEIKKQVLRKITYGLYVLTASSGDEVAAGTVNWLSQASFEPPLIMVGIKKDSRLHAIVEQAGTFAVNILASGQKDVAAAFFRGANVEDGKINGYAFTRGEKSGAPILEVVPAWFEAKVVDAVKRGDHTVFVAEVINVGLRDAEAKPLVMWETGWFYGG